MSRPGPEGGGPEGGGPEDIGTEDIGTGPDVIGTGHTGPDPDSRERSGREEETELQASNPNAGGPDRASGGMGVSSERVGHTGPGQESSDGEKDTSEPRLTDHAGDLVGSDAEGELGEEKNPEGIKPKAGYPSRDPRSSDTPYKDA